MSSTPVLVDNPPERSGIRCGAVTQALLRRGRMWEMACPRDGTFTPGSFPGEANRLCTYGVRMVAA